MAQKKKTVRQMRAPELDAIRTDVEVVTGTLDAKALARLVNVTPRLLGEIDRLKGQVADRDERLAKIGAATKRPVSKRAPKKAKEIEPERVPDSKDELQTAIPGAEV